MADLTQDQATAGNAESNSLPPAGTAATSQPFRVEVTGFNRQTAVPNPLHDFDSYTYNLSLHALTVAQFNNISSDPGGYVPNNNVLIASGGRYNNNSTVSSPYPRNYYFEEDFYFEELRMTTVINTTKRSKFSNVIEISFKIIEPNGFTLPQRLIAAVEDPVRGVGGKNYLKQPFLLQVDFMGYKSGEFADASINGTNSLKDHSKKIPIRLLDMKTRITNRGTEYSITAAPYNHNAFDPTVVRTPAEFVVQAKVVQDIFGSGNLANTSATNTNPNAREVDNSPSQSAYTGTTTLQGNGLTDRYNKWWKDLAARNTGLKPNKISVVFDPAIASKEIYIQGPNSTSNAATSANTPKQSAQQAGGVNKGGIIWQAGTLTIPAGTSIQDMVSWAISNSQYMQEQIRGSDEEKVSNRSDKLVEPLSLVKIVPKIKVLEYDANRDEYQYEITYYVKPWKTNNRHPYAPNGRVDGFVKEYSYIFGGGKTVSGEVLGNKDVLDVDLDFNMLFYNQVTAFRNKDKLFATGSTVGDPSIANQTPDGTPAASGNLPADPNNPPNIPGTQDTVARASTKFISNDVRGQRRTGANPGAAVTSQDILRTQMLDSRGDMLNLKLKIIGDPTFIKQDDIFYNQDLTRPSGLLTPNYSIATDVSELYVYVHFRSPIDYDETTGLADPNQSVYSYSVFSGIYKVITVDNIFSRGQFIQTLDLVRLSISDEQRQQWIGNLYRASQDVSVGFGQGIRFPNTATVGARIQQATFAAAGVGALSSIPGQLVNAGVNALSAELGKVVTKGVEWVVDNVRTLGIQVGDAVTGGAVSTSILESYGEVANQITYGIPDMTVDISGVNLSDLNVPTIDFTTIPDDFWI